MDKKVIIAIVAVAIIAIAGVAVGLSMSSEEESYDVVASDDSRLWIFGNADMNESLDEYDVKYLEMILDGEREETLFADANHDGRVDQADVDYLKKILDKDPKVKTYYFQDNKEDVSYVIGPTEKLGLKYGTNLYAASIMGALDKIILTDDSTLKGIKTGFYGSFLQEQEAKGIVGTFGSGTNDEYDLEAMYKTGVDTILASSAKYYFEGIEEKMTDDIHINIIRIGIWKMAQPEIGILTMAYLINDDQIIKNAKEFLAWSDNVNDITQKKVSQIKDKKSCVIIAPYPSGIMEIQGETTGCYETSIAAGMINLAKEPGYFQSDVETVVSMNPDYLIVLSYTAADWDSNQERVNSEYKSLEKWYKEWDVYKDNRVAFTAWDFSEGVFSPIMSLMMCNMFYSELFEPSFDVLDYMQEFVDKFMPNNANLSPGDANYLDVHKQGVFLGKATV